MIPFLRLARRRGGGQVQQQPPLLTLQQRMDWANRVMKMFADDAKLHTEDRYARCRTDWTALLKRADLLAFDAQRGNVFEEELSVPSVQSPLLTVRETLVHKVTWEQVANVVGMYAGNTLVRFTQCPHFPTVFHVSFCRDMASPTALGPPVPTDVSPYSYRHIDNRALYTKASPHTGDPASFVQDLASRYDQGHYLMTVQEDAREARDMSRFFIHDHLGPGAYSDALVLSWLFQGLMPLLMETCAFDIVHNHAVLSSYMIDRVPSDTVLDYYTPHLTPDGGAWRLRTFGYVLRLTDFRRMTSTALATSLQMPGLIHVKSMDEPVKNSASFVSDARAYASSSSSSEEDELLPDVLQYTDLPLYKRDVACFLREFVVAPQRITPYMQDYLLRWLTDLVSPSTVINSATALRDYVFSRLHPYTLKQSFPSLGDRDVFVNGPALVKQFPHTGIVAWSRAGTVLTSTTTAAPTINSDTNKNALDVSLDEALYGEYQVWERRLLVVMGARLPEVLRSWLRFPDAELQQSLRELERVLLTQGGLRTTSDAQLEDVLVFLHEELLPYHPGFDQTEVAILYMTVSAFLLTRFAIGAFRAFPNIHSEQDVLQHVLGLLTRLRRRAWAVNAASFETYYKRVMLEGTQALQHNLRLLQYDVIERWQDLLPKLLRDARNAKLAGRPLSVSDVRAYALKVMERFQDLRASSAVPAALRALHEGADFEQTGLSRQELVRLLDAASVELAREI